MPNLPSGTVNDILSTLRKLPVWMLGGLALAGYAVLFLPGFAGINPGQFRTQYGVWVWIEAVSLSILALTRGLDTAVEGYRARRRLAEARRVLRLVPLHHQCWWYLAKQQDDSDMEGNFEPRRIQKSFYPA
jgi:hypothetical protein